MSLFSLFRDNYIEIIHLCGGEQQLIPSSNHHFREYLLIFFIILAPTKKFSGDKFDKGTAW